MKKSARSGWYTTQYFNHNTVHIYHNLHHTIFTITFHIDGRQTCMNMGEGQLLVCLACRTVCCTMLNLLHHEPPHTHSFLIVLILISLLYLHTLDCGSK